MEEEKSKFTIFFSFFISKQCFIYFLSIIFANFTLNLKLGFYCIYLLNYLIFYLDLI